jgi:hypothetical protein
VVFSEPPPLTHQITTTHNHPSITYTKSTKQRTSYSKTRSSDTTGTRKSSAVIKVEGQTFSGKLKEIYRQALIYLSDNGAIVRLDPLLPYGFSSVRNFCAKKPQHPKGNKFRQPVEHNGYYLDADKDYDEGINQLAKLLAEIQLNVEVIKIL